MSAADPADLDEEKRLHKISIARTILASRPRPATPAHPVRMRELTYSESRGSLMRPSTAMPRSPSMGALEQLKYDIVMSEKKWVHFFFSSIHFVVPLLPSSVSFLTLCE